MPNPFAGYSGSWADLVVRLAAAALGIFGLACILTSTIREAVRSRRHAAELARQGKAPVPQPGGNAWVCVFLVTVAVMVSYQLSGKSGRPRRVSDPTVGSPALVWVSLAAPTILVLGVVGLLVWSRLRSPAALALKRANAGDIPGAIAVVEARIAAGRGPAGSTRGDPYAPPSAAIGPAARRRLADDLNTLGALEGMRGDWPTAEARYEAADALAGGTVPLYRANRGAALLKLGRVAEGLATLDEAVLDVPPGDEWTRINLLGQAAGLLADLGRATEARTRLDEAAAALDRFTMIGSKRPIRVQFDQIRARLDGAPAPDGVA